MQAMSIITHRLHSAKNILNINIYWNVHNLKCTERKHTNPAHSSEHLQIITFKELCAEGILKAVHLDYCSSPKGREGPFHGLYAAASVYPDKFPF